MKVFKKIATSVCGTIALVCLAIGGAFTLKTNVTQAASKGGYFVQGGSVRLVDDDHGAGVKFHVLMTLDEFDNYGTIDGDTLTLDDGYTTGTVILPYSLLKGDELTFGYTASNGAKAFCEYTTNLWKKVTVNGIDYAESVIYLYNIPSTDYGTEIAVRGVVFKDGAPIKYTEQENGISMSFVADAEYNDANTQLDETQLESLHDEYLEKEVTIVVSGATTTQTVDYLDYVSEEVVPERQDDGDEFVGFYTASGKEITFAEAVKNHMTVYARYRESIVLSDATPSFNLGDYKRNAGDTVTSMTFTAADGTTYDLGANPAAVTVDTLKTAYADHGEGTVTAVLNDGAYTLTLPALVVTADLTNATFTTVINYNGSSYYDSTSTTLDGYFRLKENVALTSMTVDGWGNVAGAGVNGTGGFIGTLDGLGYTISGGWTNGGGVFGAIGSGAVIKNTNFNSPYPHNGSCAVLAYAIYGATLENLTITSTSVSNYDAAAAPGDYLGYLAAQGMRASTVRNVTVNASGSIKSLFGGSGNTNYNRGTVNSYQGFYVNATHVDYIGTGTKDGEKHHYTIAEEVAAGGIIIYNGEGNWIEENVTLSGRQDFVFNGTTESTEFALDLEGHDKGYTVQSITFNGVNLGTNPDALDVSTFKTAFGSHGEGNVIVTMLSGAIKKTVTLPALFITQEITTTDEFNTIFTMDTVKSIYGYYRLANDIGNDDYAFDAANRGKTSNNKSYGLRGTFDGNGYTITGCTGSGGLFGSIGQGATIKDVTIVDRKYSSYGGWEVLARWVIGSNEENVNITNVTIKYDPKEGANRWFGSADSNSTTQYFAWLASGACYGTTFTNVTVDAPNCNLLRLFGFIQGVGYELASSTSYPNTYNSVYINAASLAYMGSSYDGTAYTHTTMQKEIDEGAKIIFNGAGWTETTVTLDGRQEFLMTDVSFSIDLGEYANQKIESIKLGETDLGTDVDDLDLSSFKTNYASHGEKTIKVVCVGGTTKTTVNVPVLLITREISSTDEFLKTFALKTDNTYYTYPFIKGYFRLANDIGDASWVFANNNRYDRYNTHGFRGTFDGNGYTITGQTGNGGLFECIGAGALIKNLTIINTGHTNNGHKAVLALAVCGAADNPAVLENVNIKFQPVAETADYLPWYNASTGNAQGWLTSWGVFGVTFRDVTIDASSISDRTGGYRFSSVFGRNGNDCYEYSNGTLIPNTYESLILKGRFTYSDVDLSQMGCLGYDAINGKVVTVADEAASGANIIFNGEDMRLTVDAEITEPHDLVLNGGNAGHIDLGIYSNLTVTSITLTTANGTTYDLGTNPEDVTASAGFKALKEAYADHGEGATIVVATEKNKITFTNVTVVTLEITNETSFYENTAGPFMFNDTNPYFDTDTKTIDGYFTLGEDVSYLSTPNNSQIDGGLSYDNPSHGFIGTFDGRGYTMTHTQSAQYGASTRGLFGQVGSGAVVKNVTMIIAGYQHRQYESILGTAAYNATFENVTFEVAASGVSGYDGTVVDARGFLTELSISGCTFNDVTVNLNGQHIVSLFGGRAANGYEEDFSPGGGVYPGQNVYNNFVINGTVDYIGTGHDLNKTKCNFTIEDEIMAGAGITYNGNTFANYLPTTNYLAAKDTDGNWYSDYTIVYDASNEDIEELVDFLRDQIQRATGGVTYAKGSNGEFTETVGGLQLRKAAGATWHANARYIVIGNEDMRDAAGLATPVTEGYDFTIQEVDNSVFIFSANEEDYVSAILRFLEETIGFKGLSDDYVVYNDITDLNLADKLTQTINGNVALAIREDMKSIDLSKDELLGINGRMGEVWSVVPDVPETGVEHMTHINPAFHNSIFWVPKTAATTDSDSTNWYASDRDASTENAYDLCYTAHGNAASYTRMVATAANNMYAKLKAAGASETKNVNLTFTLMDDWNYEACYCTTCRSYNDTALMLNFLTDVALRIETLANDDNNANMKFTIYTLAYHCYEGPATADQLNAAAAKFNYDSTNTKTILDTKGQLNKHLGVIYAPAPTPDDGYVAAAAQSIYAEVNATIHSNMAAWDALTDNVGIWFYNTYFSNYMMPFGSFSSMLTWIEYAARLFADDNMVWSFVQGQNGAHLTTGFDAFKTYMVQKAQIEILEKVDYNDTSIAYDTQIATYLLELEQEFFGFTGNGSAESQFNDKGYYGPAAANYNMYQFYKALSADYTAMITNKKYAYKSDKSAGTSATSNCEIMVGRTNEHYDYMTYTHTGWLSDSQYYGKYTDWLEDSNAKDENTYMVNWTKDQIEGYLGYVENAMVAVTKMTSVNGNKDVYLQHIMLESLFPRFVICNGNHLEYWASGYTTSKYDWAYGGIMNGESTFQLWEMRDGFKYDCETLGITNYCEGGAMSAVYTMWGY